VNHIGLPFAAGDWSGGAIFLAFVIFSLLAQLVGKWQESQKEAARRARRAPPQRPPQAGGPLEDEIAEFLRRRVQGQKPTPSERPAPPPPPLPTSPPMSPPAREPKRRPRPPRAPRPARVEPMEAELVVVPAERKEVLRRDVWAAPKPSSAGPQPTATLATEAFPATVGVAGPAPPTASAATAPAVNAATLAALLANPANLRQAVLLTEILRRPGERFR